MPDNLPLKLYRLLIRAYPRGFRERFAESLEQTFGDLRREKKGYAKIFIDTALSIFRERAAEVLAMKNTSKTAVISALLAFPGIALFSLMMLNIEPPFAEALQGEPDVPNIAGSLIALTLALLLPAAFVISLRPVIKARRTGNGVLALPANLAVAVVSIGFFAFIIGAMIVDQYPCWMGVPNCD